jgi:hypothetical protein
MTKQGKPQQSELRRSERGRVDRDHWKRHQEPEGQPRDDGSGGPVPEENRPGHHPEEEQDKPESTP